MPSKTKIQSYSDEKLIWIYNNLYRLFVDGYDGKIYSESDFNEGSICFLIIKEYNKRFIKDALSN